MAQTMRVHSFYNANRWFLCRIDPALEEKKYRVPHFSRPF
jgi:hypothetical protein